MGRNACTKSGNDEVYTPLELCNAVVSHYNPSGRVLEPCDGGGAFVKAFINHGISDISNFDISRGVDFLQYADTEPIDWLITNPPFSLLHKFTRKGMELKIPNLVFLCYANTFMMNGKFNSLKEFGYSIVEMAFCTSPHYHKDFDSFDPSEQWPQSGFALSATHIKYTGLKEPMARDMKVSYLDW
jgi:hypothetical protein